MNYKDSNFNLSSLYLFYLGKSYYLITDFKLFNPRGESIIDPLDFNYLDSLFYDWNFNNYFFFLSKSLLDFK